MNKAFQKFKNKTDKANTYRKDSPADSSEREMFVM